MFQVRDREKESRREADILRKAYELIAGFDSYRFEEEFLNNNKCVARRLHCRAARQACITYRIFNKFRRWLNVQDGDAIMISVVDKQNITIVWFEYYDD